MRAIESLNLKAIRDNRNHWKVSPEDADMWAAAQWAPTGQRPPEMPTPAHLDLTSELAASRAENAQLRERLADRDALIADLREDREKWRQQAAALLEDKRPKGFLKRLLGR